MHQLIHTSEEHACSFVQGNLVECVKHYVGCSLDHRGQELREFLARGVDDPGTIVNAHISDCGLFALAVWRDVGVQDLRLTEKYQVGAAIAWLVDIAGLHHAIRHSHDGLPSVGALLHYHSHGKNDDHVEFLLSPVKAGTGWVAHHAGGGRADCAIGEGTSNIMWSLGRPLQAWYDIDALAPVVEN